MFTTGAFASSVLIFLLMPLAVKIGFQDHPTPRKQHDHATPLVGGVSLILAFALTVIAFLPHDVAPFGLLAAAALLGVTTLLDDVVDLPWFVRLIAQAAAAAILILVDGTQVAGVGALLGMGSLHLGVLSVPFTIFATVGLINAINMVDGVDGLAGGVSVCTLLMFAAASAYAGNAALLAVLVIAVGALCGFLVFNLRLPWQRQARVFLGNSGSEFLGLLIAWGAFRLTQTPQHPVSAILAPFLLALPVIDCLVLIIRRIRAGRSPFAADRSHFHHLMLSGGYSHSEIVIAMCLSTLTIGGAAAVFIKLHWLQPILIVVFLAMMFTYMAVTHSSERTVARLAAIRADLRRIAIGRALLNTGAAGSRALDVAEVGPKMPV